MPMDVNMHMHLPHTACTRMSRRTRQALSKYGVDLVVASLLQTRKSEARSQVAS